ncbi:MAG: 5-methylcytosine restriction system specificity protein McrC [bacterium]
MNASDTSATDVFIHRTEYGIPIRNLWYMLLYAWNELPTKNLLAPEDVEIAPTLDALLAAILAKLMRQRLRIGLGRSYINEKHLLRGIRGRVNFTDSVNRHAFEHGQAYCQYQLYSVNAHKNQIVRSTLVRLVQMGQFGSERVQADKLRQSLRRLVRDLEGVDLIKLKLDFINRQQLGRNDRDYLLMLTICELILRRQMPADSTGQHHLPGLNRDALVMHYIYERFVTNFYRTHLYGWAVSPQKYLNWHAKSPNQFLPSMKPDLVLEEKSSRRIVVLDTKFTAQSLVKSQWSTQGFNSSHLTKDS